MTRRGLLLGAGADIGSNLLLLNEPEVDGFELADVVTHAPANSVEGSLDDIMARLTLAGTGRHELRKDVARCAIWINGQEVRFHFGDIQEELHRESESFDLAVLATSRRDIRDTATVARVQAVAPVVLCAAEAPQLPAYFPILDVSAAAALFVRPSRLKPGAHHGALPLALALGSCQCAGWAGQLRCVLEATGRPELILGASTTIVHPDTASSQFGTSGLGARREDPRDNLRPGFSQLAESFRRFALAYTSNDTSLRVLTAPPGFQVSQFFVEGELTADELIAACERVARAEPRLVATAPSAIGSRAFAANPQLTTVITDPSHVTCDRFDLAGQPLTRVVMRAWTHNTVGYATTILEAGRRLLADANQPVQLSDSIAHGREALHV